MGCSETQFRAFHHQTCSFPVNVFYSVLQTTCWCSSLNITIYFTRAACALSSHGCFFSFKLKEHVLDDFCVINVGVESAGVHVLHVKIYLCGALLKEIQSQIRLRWSAGKLMFRNYVFKTTSSERPGEDGDVASSWFIWGYSGPAGGTDNCDSSVS